MPSPDRLANGDAGKPDCLTIIFGMVALVLSLVVIVVMIVAGASAAQAAPLTAGHRGATGVAGYPEQSLKAIGYVATYGGVMVEGDVRFTENDYAVMAHNDTAPGCTVPISTQTFAELRLCAGSSVTPQLLFWLREAKRLGLSANVELKTTPTDHQAEVFRRTIVDEAPDEVIVASFHPETLEAAEAVLGDRVEYAPIIAPTGSPFGYSVAEHAAKYDTILADYRWMIVARMHWYADAGVRVILWTANTDDAIIRCKALANAEPDTAVIVADDVRKVTGQ